MKKLMCLGGIALLLSYIKSILMYLARVGDVYTGPWHHDTDLRHMLHALSLFSIKFSTSMTNLLGTNSQTDIA